MTRSGSRAEKARRAPPNSPPHDRPWWTPERSLGAIQHQNGRSFFTPSTPRMWFGKYGLKHDVLKSVERGRATFDLHAENCAFPGSQEEFGEIHRIEPRIDFTGGLRLGNARSKRSTPFLKYCLQPLAQEFALRALQTEIAD